VFSQGSYTRLLPLQNDVHFFYPLNSFAQVEIIRSLLHKGILERQDDQLYIAVALFEYWIKKRQLLFDNNLDILCELRVEKFDIFHPISRMPCQEDIVSTQ